MSKLSTKPISESITDGYVHIILPDLGEPTGWKSYRIKLEDFASGAPSASAVTTNTSNFDNNLSASDDTVQKALETLDELIASGSTGTTSNTFTIDSDSNTGKIILDVALNAGQDRTMTITNAAMTADVTATIPAKTGTFAMTSDIYDATIGAGGEYEDIAAAQTAGKYILKAIGNITVAANLTLSANIYLNLNGFTMTMASYTVDVATYNLRIDCNSGIISINRAGAGAVFIGAAKNNYQLQINNGTLTLITSTSNVSLGKFGIFTGMVINMPNASYSGFGCETGNTGFFGVISYSNIVGGGSSCSNCIYEAGSTNWCLIQHCIFSGTFSSGNFIALNTGSIKNVKYTSASTCTMFVSDVDGFIDLSGKVTITLYSSTTTVLGKIRNSVCASIKAISYSKIENCIFLGASTIVSTNAQQGIYILGCYFASTLSITVVTGRDIIIDSCKIIGATTLDGDYFKFINNICTGLVTLNSGVEYSLISGNTLTGGLTDNSASATNIIKDNI